MLKKNLVTLVFLTTLIFAKTTNVDSIQGNYNEGAITFIISTNNLNEPVIPDKTSKDWIALYKKNDSNAWSNVLTWGWAKDFGSERDGDAILIKNIKLDNGEYEARFFKNNSFTTYKKSKPFKVGKAPIKRPSSLYLWIENNQKIHMEYRGYNISVANKDWIGLYKKDDSNAWSNVITWAWAKDIRERGIEDPVPTYTLTKTVNNLQDGRYELRYFKNNSFTTYKKSEPFKVNTKREELRARADDNYVYIVMSTPLQHTAKDWVGIYKKDDSNSWNNVLTWVWAKDIENGIPDQHAEEIRTTFLKIHLPNGKYEARYFLNNTFKTYKSSGFTVK